MKTKKNGVGQYRDDLEGRKVRGIYGVWILMSSLRPKDTK